MSMPKVEIKTDASGRVTYSVTEEGVLLTKEQAERIASRIAELEELVRVMHGYLFGVDHSGCKSCPVKDECIELPRCQFPDYVELCMSELGIEVSGDEDA